VVWENDKAVSADLYYDPVVDEHVGRGPMGLIAPAWYFAPQRNSVAEVGWATVVAASGVMSGVINPEFRAADRLTFLLQLSGEFADPETKQHIWSVAEEYIEPNWDKENGEFTLGLGLNEPYPRGQLNARIMAGWSCKQGAWSRIFNKPNLTKFEEPTIIGVDFPSVALSVAQWDGKAMHLAAHAQNAQTFGTETTVQMINVPSSKGWSIVQGSGARATLTDEGDSITITLVANNVPITIQQN
jgi:hypothetical protein